MADTNWTPETAIEQWKQLQQHKESLEQSYDEKIAPIKAAHEEALAPVEENISELESWFISRAEQDGTDEYKSDAGLISINTRDKPKIEDAEAFYEWVETTKNSELLQKRLSVTKFRSYVKDNNGEIPPGVSVESERSVKFSEA